jgi:multicomponent Na+:H+ antiporter subunit C
MLSVNVYLGGALMLYAVGVYCLVTKRNMIKLVIGIEILANAANLSFIALSTRLSPEGVLSVDPLGHSFVVISIAIGGSIIAVALAMVVSAYRHYKTLDVRELKRLKW